MCPYCPALYLKLFCAWIKKKKAAFIILVSFNLFSWSRDNVLVRCVGRELPMMSDLVLIKKTCFGHIKHPLKHCLLSGEALCIALEKWCELMRQEDWLTESKTGQIKCKELELLLWIMRLLLLISQGINLEGLAGWV